MDLPDSILEREPKLKFKLSKYRNRVWIVSLTAIFLSLLGIILCCLDPSIKAPLRPGLDFTGGTQIQLERICEKSCSPINTNSISEELSRFSLPKQKDGQVPNLSLAKIQLLDESRSLVLRLPFLNASQSNKVINQINLIAGPIDLNVTSIETIGPSLGLQLLRSSLASLFVAFLGITLYITIRYDRQYALLALLALAHDVLIVCGIFAWFGLLLKIEVDSLFAVSLLTIAGYSVNDTVVVFDRIREFSRNNSLLSVNYAEKIDMAVSATLTRTIYTSGTTLLPLIALNLFGGSTLFWFSLSLALGVIIGSWSSIALAPSLLSVWKND